jgi:small subunit ribosomal protein S2
MKPYIFGARNGIYIIDLQQTVRMFKTAYEFVVETVASGESILFVGTKKQARDAIYEEANRCEMFYVHNRWLGGMLTNFQTIKKGIQRLKHLIGIFADGSVNRFPKKEILRLEKERTKLESNLGGIINMQRLPGALFIVDPKNENIAVREARRLSIPTVAIVDSNCNPDEVDYIIPGNDDAIRAIRLMTSRIADACVEGRERMEERLQAEADKAVEAGAVAGPGERAVISDGSEGPIVEIVRKSPTASDQAREDAGDEIREEL